MQKRMSLPCNLASFLLRLVLRPLFLVFLSVAWLFLTSGLGAKGLEETGGDYVCKRLGSAGRKNVAVFPFTDSQNEQTEESRLATARFLAALSKCTGLRIIEKEKTNKILEEQASAQSGLVDAKSAPKIGKMIGADSLVFGALLKNALEVRLVDAETGEILGAKLAEAGGSRTEAKPSITQMDAKEAKDGLEDQQIRRTLKRMYKRHPALLVYVLSTSEDIARFKRRRPRAAHRFFGRFEKMPKDRRQKIEELRETVLARAKRDPEIRRKIHRLKKRAIRKIQKKHRR